MNDWNKLDFVTDEDSGVVRQRTGWETVKFELTDDDSADEEAIIARNFFGSFESGW